MSEAPLVYVAGLWRRLPAAVVDLVIVLPAAYLLARLAGRLAGVGLPAARNTSVDYWLDLALAGDPALWGFLGLSLTIGLLYLLLFQAMAGRTLGMRLLRLRVIDIYGDPPGLLRALVRTLGYVASALTLCLGFLWIGFDREKRGLHDWVAGTYVIKAR